jgi:hypothetical protein
MRERTPGSADASAAGALPRRSVTPSHVRTAMIGVLGLLGVASIALAAWSLGNGGIGWDAHFDTEAALVIRSIDPDASLEQAYGAAPLTSEVYGVVVQQLADVLHRVTTGSTDPLQPDDPATYVYQGVVNLLLAVVASTALGLALAMAFRSVLAGVFAWSLLSATPLWLGMSHVDAKDIPIAAGLTLVTAGLVLILAARPERSRRWTTVVGALLITAGATVSLTARPGSVVLVAALGGGTAAIVAGTAIALRLFRRPTDLSLLPVLVAVEAALVVAVAVTWATNPVARIDTAAWFGDAIRVASSYPVTLTIRTAGRDLTSDALPLWYVPAWLGVQLPLLTLAAVVAASIALAARSWRGRSRFDARSIAVHVPIVLQALVLPAAIVLSGAVLYDGLRHLLFMLPGLLALPAIVLARLDRAPPIGAPWVSTVAPVAAAVVVAASILASARWAPYAYAYLNPLAGRDDTDPSWERDYWGVTAREGVNRLRDLGLATVSVQPINDVGRPWGSLETTAPSPGDTGLYVFARGTYSAADFGCTVVFTVRRGGHVLGEGARC